MKKLKIFDYESFLNVAVDAYQAKKIAEIADLELKKHLHIQYGVHENNEYRSFSSEQKPHHTHAQFAFATKKLKE